MSNAYSVQNAEWRQQLVAFIEAIDAVIAALDPAFLSRIETEGKPLRLNRAGHREHHLQQVEKALA
jgi:hypothetical protein